MKQFFSCRFWCVLFLSQIITCRGGWGTLKKKINNLWWELLSETKYKIHQNLPEKIVRLAYFLIFIHNYFVLVLLLTFVTVVCQYNFFYSDFVFFIERGSYCLRKLLNACNFAIPLRIMLWQHVGDLWPLRGYSIEKWTVRRGDSNSGLWASVSSALAIRPPPSHPIISQKSQLVIIPLLLALFYLTVALT